MMKIDEQFTIPPWITFPNSKGPGDIGFKMGYGEIYVENFYKFLQSLTIDERNKYILNNPEPIEWEFYYRWMFEE